MKHFLGGLGLWTKRRSEKVQKTDPDDDGH